MRKHYLNLFFLFVIFAFSIITTQVCCKKESPVKTITSSKKIKELGPFDWFPFEKGYMWILNDGKIDRDFEIIFIRDAFLKGEQGRAVLSTEDRQERNVTFNMVVEVSKENLLFGFIPFCSDLYGYAPIEVDPPMPIIKTPVLQGNTWQWHGTAFFIDPGDNINKRAPANANAVIKNVTGIVTIPVGSGKEEKTYDGLYASVNIQMAALESNEKAEMSCVYGFIPGKGIVSFKRTDRDENFTFLTPLSEKEGKPIIKSRNEIRDFNASVDKYQHRLDEILNQRDVTSFSRLFQSESVISNDSEFSISSIPWNDITNCHGAAFNTGETACRKDFVSSVKDKDFCYGVSVVCSRSSISNGEFSVLIYGFYDKNYNAWNVKKYHLYAHGESAF